MTYSITVDGKVKDYHFIRQNDFTVNFYIGDIYVGQIFKLNGYTAMLCKPHPHNKVHGFKTRLAAAEYLLRIGGYRNNG